MSMAELEDFAQQNLSLTYDQFAAALVRVHGHKGSVKATCYKTRKIFDQCLATGTKLEKVCTLPARTHKPETTAFVLQR